MRRLIRRVGLACLVASLGALGLAWWIGVAYSSHSGQQGYFEKLNWVLYPVYFAFLLWCIQTSWKAFLEGWTSLASSGVLHEKGQPSADATLLGPLLTRLREQRRTILILSALLGLALTAIDAGCLWGEYRVIPGLKQCTEQDFSIAFRLDGFVGVSQTASGMFVLLVYLLQGAVIAGGWLLLLQFVLQSTYMLRFEKLDFTQAGQLKLRLNVLDPMKEFGLCEMNRAVNLLYVFIAVGMLVPVISAQSQPHPDVADHGQLLIRFLVPLLFLTPLLLTIVDRWARVREASRRARMNPALAQGFASQSLWPFDKTQVAWLGKIAMAAVVAEYSFLAHSFVAELVKVLAK